jgi:hypothetical protein
MKSDKIEQTSKSEEMSEFDKAKKRYYTGCIGSDECTADDYVKELEQQVDIMVKALELYNLQFDERGNLK